ncbi:1-alkyl-2-acetylglycerophosphocholine esterase [Scedosporium apiospermum]|uniref:1-alkyl-2-acetylglycerophosphocholine esterase n=1 Tax=Pseudallescheria apiosperma TaxID=563466 RepID=A0A084G7V1_PSEDA|nr:1-alkyl-2-acetylglycerophosphocholine esterase [Scedosporium apiospermum]KEZ43413.1 1-alkyl-2-acetylglycerophosphocholine esterase [Scedosporium apiospermum]
MLKLRLRPWSEEDSRIDLPRESAPGKYIASSKGQQHPAIRNHGSSSPKHSPSCLTKAFESINTGYVVGAIGLPTHWSTYSNEGDSTWMQIPLAAVYYNSLHISAELGNARIVQFLLDNDVDVDGVDSSGRTALHYAARGAHIEVVSRLLAGGADSEARDYNGLSPLHAAAEAGCEAVIRLLARGGADLNASVGISRDEEVVKEGIRY